MGTQGYLFSSMASVVRRTLNALPSADQAYDIIFGRPPASHPLSLGEKENEEVPAAKRQRRSAADLNDVKDQEVFLSSAQPVAPSNNSGVSGTSLLPASAVLRTAELEQQQSSKVSIQLARPYVGVHTVQNVRPYQEDRASFIIINGVAYLAIYDGHAGASTSSYLQANLLKSISSNLHEDGVAGSDSDIRHAIEGAYCGVNTDLRRKGFGCGSTATTVMIEGNRLICANCGDSPAFVVMKSGDVYLITAEHSPNEEEERRRVERAGGRISQICWGDKGLRVISQCSFAGLAMTRAFGDYKFTGVICDPFICTMDDMDETRYVVLASDGLTESWSVEEAAHYLLQLAETGMSCSTISRKMTEKAIQQGSRDNVTVMVMDVAEYLASPTRRQPFQTVWEAAVEDDTAAVAANAPAAAAVITSLKVEELDAKLVAGSPKDGEAVCVP